MITSPPPPPLLFCHSPARTVEGDGNSEIPFSSFFFFLEVGGGGGSPVHMWLCLLPHKQSHSVFGNYDKNSDLLQCMLVRQLELC